MFGYSLNCKELREKLSKKLELENQKENAPIKIRDIVVIWDINGPSEEYAPSFGEYKIEMFYNFENSYQSVDAVERLIDHIKLLFAWTNGYHGQSYCKFDGKKFVLKKEHANTITRLSLNEFSFYGQNPLSLREFEKIIQAIQQLAIHSLDNTHLLLSSFSVVNEAGEILNVTLYVQGGEEAKVNSICKGHASNEDPRYNYGKISNFSQQNLKKGENISAFIVNENEKISAISNNNILVIKTKGGAKYLQAIDICLDHIYKHSKRLLGFQLKTLESDASFFLPEQVDQIVTSNSCRLKDEAMVKEANEKTMAKRIDLLMRTNLKDTNQEKVINTTTDHSGTLIKYSHCKKRRI